MKLLDLLTDPVRLPLALALLAAVARVLYAIVSRVAAPYPRARAAVEAVVALLPDVLRAGLQLVAVATGRPAPRLDLVPADPRAEERAVHLAAGEVMGLRATVVDLTEERDALARRVAELTAAEEPGRLRPTVVPGEEPRVNEATRAAVTGRHRIPPGTMGALCLALACAGCGSTDGATAALATATTAIKAAATVRQYLCARELDPLLGDPRPAPASSGGTSQPLSPAPAPPSSTATTTPAMPPSQPLASPPAASDAGAPAQDGGL